MSDLTTAVLELIDHYEQVQAEQMGVVLGALTAARASVEEERRAIERQVEAVRAEHARGEIDDDHATYVLHLLADELEALADEQGEINNARETWCRFRAPPVDPELVALLEADEQEEREAREVARAAWPRTPAPTWPPITDAEIAEWRTKPRTG